MEGTGDRWSQAPGLPGAASLCSPCHSQAQLAPRSARAVPKVCFCLDQTSDGGGRGQAGSRAGWCLSAECQGQRLYLRPTPLTLFLRPKPSKNSPQMASLTLLSSVKRGQMVSESPASAREQAPCHPTCKRARSGLHQVGRVLCRCPGQPGAAACGLGWQQTHLAAESALLAGQLSSVNCVPDSTPLARTPG